MGDVLSKPGEPRPQEAAADGAAEQVPPAQLPQGKPRRCVKVTPSRLKMQDSGGEAPAETRAAVQQAAAPSPAIELPAERWQQAEPQPKQALPAAPLLPEPHAKRKATEPADGGGGKRQQLLGLTMLTLGVLQGMAPFRRQAACKQAAAGEAMAGKAVAGAAASAAQGAAPPSVEQQQQQQQQQQAPAVQPSLQSEPAAAAAAPGSADEEAAAAGTPLGIGPEGAAEEEPQCMPVAVPLSAAKPVTRSQLRQQLQLRTHRSSGAPLPAARARTCATTVLAAAARSTRGQRLLGLARPPPAPDAEAQPLEAPEGMQLAAAEQQAAGADASSMDADDLPSAEVAPAAAVVAEQAAVDATPSKPPPVALLAPTVAEPGSGLRTGQLAPREGASPARLCSSPVPSAREGDVEAALQQVGRLLVDLRDDSPQPSGWQWHGALVPEPAGSAAQEGRLAAAAEGKAGGSATAMLECEAQSRWQGCPVPQQGAGAVPPCSPPEVSSKPREDGGDNFPGFWRPPAAGGPANGAATAVAPTRGGIGKRQRQEQQLEGEEGTPLRGKDRRVRFCVPAEAVEATEQPDAVPAAADQQQQQQPAGPTPLVVAAPVLPSGRSAAARPSTPAKPPAPVLKMPQPPAYSRFGTTAFLRPYAGPQGRRQALLSFVSEGGATCFALPPVPLGAPPPEAEGADGGGSDDSDPAPAAGEEAQLIIPRRLQHRQGLGRRLSLQPVPASPQDCELLAQEVREAFLNARLADHAGEPWARLDMAGCELVPGSAHAEVLQELSAKLQEQQGAELVGQLLGQLDAEWQHLKKVRQKYVGVTAAAAAAAPSPPEHASAASPPLEAPVAPGSGTADEGGRPRGILKHRSSFNGSGDEAAAPAAAAAAAELAAEAAAEQAAPAVAPPAIDLTAAAAAAAAAADAAAMAAVGFEAILAAHIVQEGAAAPSAEDAAPTAAPATPAPEAAAGEAGTSAAAYGQAEGSPEHMDVDADSAAANTSLAAGPAAAQLAAEPSPGAPAACQAAPAACGEDAAPAADATVDAAAAAPVNGNQDAAAGEAEPLSPRPVELTPGPSLSRGQKMLAHLGTPVAAGKLQQLLATGSAEQGRRARAFFPAPGSLKVQTAPSSGGGAPRHAGSRMSRGERLLAALKGGSGAAASPAGASPAAAQPASEAADEGPTLAPAAAVLL